MSGGYKIDLNFNGSTGNPGGNDGQAGGSSSDFLNQVLSKLNGAVDKLVMAINRQSAGTTNSGLSPQNNPVSKEQAMQKLMDTATISAIAVTTVRWMNANASALMAQGGNRGAFAASGIAGTANQTFGSYVGNTISIERQREIQRNLALFQGGGAIAGGAIGGEIGGPKGLLGGLGFGGAAGNYAAAKLENQKIEEKMIPEQAEATRKANASTSEWQTGFSRFGLARQNTEIATAGETGSDPMYAHLSGAFDKKYGGSQNYNAILNNIVPYLQSSPLNMQKTGDLGKVSQNFLQAGFAVSQFSALTMQASQYQALTGKNLQQFSDDLKTSRSKYGDVYDEQSSQTALNLMSMGYSPSAAQNIAFQSKYNSGILNSTSQFTSMGAPSYYSAMALGKPLGFDLFNTIKKGQFQGSSQKRTDLLQQIKTAENGGGLSNDLMILQSQGYNMGEVSQWLQPKVNPLKNAVNSKSSPSDAQTQASSVASAIREAMTAGNMIVNATTVTINNLGSAINSAGIMKHLAAVNNSKPFQKIAQSPMIQRMGGNLAIKKL